MEDGAGAVDGDLALLPVRSDDVLSQNAVEVYAEFFGDDVEVIEVGVRSIVLHDHEHAAGINPLRDLGRIFGLGEMRKRIFVEVVG